MKKIFLSLFFIVFCVCLRPLGAYAITPADSVDAVMEERLLKLYTDFGTKQLEKLIAQNAENDSKGESFKNKYIVDFKEALALDAICSKYVYDLTKTSDPSTIPYLIPNIDADLEQDLNIYNSKLTDNQRIYFAFNLHMGSIHTTYEINTINTNASGFTGTTKTDFQKVKTNADELLSGLQTKVCNGNSKYVLVVYGRYRQILPISETSFKNDGYGWWNWKFSNVTFIKDPDEKLKGAIYNQTSLTPSDLSKKAKLTFKTIYEALSGENISPVAKGFIEREKQGPNLTTRDESFYNANKAKIEEAAGYIEELGNEYTILYEYCKTAAPDSLTKYQIICANDGIFNVSVLNDFVLKLKVRAERLKEIRNCVTTQPNAVAYVEFSPDAILNKIEVNIRICLVKAFLQNTLMQQHEVQLLRVIRTVPDNQVKNFLDQIVSEKLLQLLYYRIDDSFNGLGLDNFTSLFKVLDAKRKKVYSDSDLNKAAKKPLLANIPVWGDYNVKGIALQPNYSAQNDYISVTYEANGYITFEVNVRSLPSGISKLKYKIENLNPFTGLVYVLFKDEIPSGITGITLENNMVAMPAYMLAWIVTKNQGDRIKLIVNTVIDVSLLALGVGELTASYRLLALANRGDKFYKAGVLLRAGWGAYDAVSGITDVLKPAIVGTIKEKYCKNKPEDDPKCKKITDFIKSVEDVKAILDITSLGGHGIDGLINLVSNWRKVKTEIPDLETQFPQFNQIDDAIDGTDGIAKKCEDIDACFIAGTLITTPSGYKPIEQIKAGDLVLSKDPATGKEDYKTVKQAIVRHTNALVRIIAQKDTIFATPEHPFWVNNRWVEAAKIKTGDKLTLAATNDFTATNAPQSQPYLARSSIEAEQVQLIDTTATVYNFEVEDFHTYFVGKQAVWVHNDPNHFDGNPLPVRHPDWVEIRDITSKVDARLSHVNYLDFSGNGFHGCHTQNAMDEFLTNHPGFTGGFIDASGSPIALIDNSPIEAYPWVKDANGNIFTKSNGSQTTINGKQYGKASFFPKNWNTARLKAEVEFAIANNHGKVNPTNPSSNVYFGYSIDGTIEIQFYYNISDGRIISYFPKVR